MSGTIDPNVGEYTLTELAQVLGVDAGEAAGILDEHGFRVPAGEERLAITEEMYLDLMEEAPLVADDAEG
jgi:hypothetical protein